VGLAFMAIPQDVHDPQSVDQSKVEISD